MSWIDWSIVIVPLFAVLFIAWHCRKYITGVADFLAAGRVCGRYVLSVASDTSGAMGAIVLLAYVETHYKTGFALNFWNNLRLPLSVFLALTGFCVYRFRATRVLSFGQFIEMRYSRGMRIFTSFLRTTSEILASMIAPALAARFFIYMMGLPPRIVIGGFEIQTFMIIVFLVLIPALLIIWFGGQLALIITDTIQGLICMPLLVIFVGFILYHFSWGSEIVPVMLDRAPTESFLNPYDVSGLRDFNLFALGVTLFSMVLHCGSWIGGGTSSAAISPHEQKMAGVFGAFRGGFYMIFSLLLAAMLLTFLNHQNYAGDAKKARDSLSNRIVGDIISDPQTRYSLTQKFANIPVQRHVIGNDKPLSEKNNLDTPYFDAFAAEVNKNGLQKSKTQEFITLFHQQKLAVVMRNILPQGMIGAFCLLMLLMMLSTDDSRIFSSSGTIVQDLIVPLLKKPLAPESHLKLLKLVSVGVGICFLLGSTLMAQMDYINLFVSIVCAIYMGGCGPVVLFGMYSRFGNTAGAYTSMISGMILSLGGILLQRHWANIIYPWLIEVGYAEDIGNFLSVCSAPFSPYVVWEMNPIKFPINSLEIYTITMLFSLILYFLVSFITYRKPFNLDRMLHREKYALQGENFVRTEWSLHSIFSRIIGITSEYSTGDKIIAWSSFLYMFVFQFLILFVAVAVLNLFSPLPNQFWGNYFLIQALAVPGIIAIISTVWFMIGGIIDLRKMFIALKLKTDNPLDDGRVEGHVSIADQAAFNKIENDNQRQNP